MQRRALLIAFFVSLSACGGSPTSPGTRTLSGTVSSNGLPLAGASVTIMDGIHAGVSRDTDNNGAYSFLGLTPSAFTLQARRGGLAQDKGVDLTYENRSVHFQLTNICLSEPELC
jgi:carboxypeptidase family protein